MANLSEGRRFSINPFACAVQLIGAIAGVAQQFANAQLTGSGTRFNSAESLVAFSTSMGGDLGGLASNAVGWKMIANSRVMKAEGAANAIRGSYTIPLTIVIVDGLQLLTGFREPPRGDDLDAGAAQFTALGAQLVSAFPGEDWQGLGALAYGRSDTVLCNLAVSLADLDAQFAAVIRVQSDWVTHIRLGFGVLKDLLAVALLVECALRLAPPFGPGAAVKFALLICTLALSAAMTLLFALAYYSDQHAAQAHALIPGYEQCAAGAAVARPRPAAHRGPVAQ